MNTIPFLEEFALLLHPSDNIAVARAEIPPGLQLALPGGGSVTTIGLIQVGHKLALQAVAVGEPVRRCGCEIGRATAVIPPGAWVHTHNLSTGPIERSFDFAVVPVVAPRPTGRTFRGFLRPNGRVGTRNYFAVIASSNCAAHTARLIAAHFTPEILKAYPNVDGVVAVTHASGCSITPEGEAFRYLQRTLANLTVHPNVGGAIVVGLGCEVMQASECCGPVGASLDGLQPPGVQRLVIQELGGINPTVQAGVAAVEKMLPELNRAGRTPQPLAGLMLALQCGGSDTWSGVTANPLIGRVADLLVNEGGTAVLAETPEIFGAETLLTRRVANAAAGQKLVERLQWWQTEAKKLGFTVDNNPTPGNKAGGLTTIYEKSLGAAAKGGTTPVNAVYEYAELVQARGLVFMDSPGNDAVSVTGQVSGGCNLVVFSTGRGSVFGGLLAPTLKIASNSELFHRMQGDMDFNAGELLEAKAFDTAAAELLDLVVAAASGEVSKSERWGTREAEFVPWQPGAVL